MNILRYLTDFEKTLITVLLSDVSSSDHLVHSLDRCLATEMDDGQMGSLTLIPSGLQNKNRSFWREIASGEFTDADGVLVSVSLNIDEEGQLYELDVWKVDFSALISWPDPTQIRRGLND